jgi:hypothetical protein
MATFSKLILSNSTDGLPVNITQTVTAGTLVHTGSTTASHLDELWIYATNNHSASVLLTIEYGNATTSNNIKVTVPNANGLYLVVGGLLLKGNAVPLTVRAFAATTAVISLSGYVNRIAV